MTVYDLIPNLIEDETELGMKVALALYVENCTDEDNFIRVLKFKHKLKKGDYV